MIRSLMIQYYLISLFVRVNPTYHQGHGALVRVAAGVLRRAVRPETVRAAGGARSVAADGIPPRERAELAVGCAGREV